MRALFAGLALLAPALAFASPPHAVVEVKPGDVTFQRLYDVRALASIDPSIATAELMPSQEVLITGKKPGTTEVVALVNGKVVGLRVHVRAPGTLLPDEGAARLAAVEKACPQHRLLGEGADQQLGATPTAGACRAALFALFATDKFLVKQIAIDFDQPSLQAQAAEVEAAVRAAKLPVELHYQGATLVLKGSVTREQAAKLAVALYLHALGGVPLDDGELELEEPDAGAPAAAADQPAAP
jgi:Flp pilus assembly secretin CpaC